ncbi:nucleoporin Pom152 [Plectosphaerella cucumerina]|uniref:Nucleoporin Pom152 n=1 Tax=Plectosphaerella cucumerina TaxID=40658 RepID=A0A8K0WZ45_9PEZI|nr:nucleoporin Pom152 [Plectosphaerella cucumerina]
MSDTPRQRTGGFPGTPATAAASRRRVPLSPPDSSPPSASSQPSDRRSSSLPLAPESAPRPAANQPLIPLTFLDGPQQRFYAAAAYVVLWGWKLFDYVRLVENDASSVGLFLKWVIIDMVFLVGLPELRIPWLELSQSTAWTLWAVHSFFNWLLMFNIGIPLQPWLIGFLKVFYDREISVSEQSVKVSSILHNHSLIMGRQIINILPEGSAILNYEHTPFCLSQPGRDTVKIPIQFNATIPAEIELIRIDLDTDNEEVIKVTHKEIKKIVKSIKELLADSSGSAVQTIEYPVKKTGIYRLGKVLDEYKLEVQRTTKDTYVVPCPQAKFRASGAADRCIRDLSDLFVDVTGTPPLKIKYSRMINSKDQSFHFQSLQPEDYSSPLLGSPSSSMVLAGDGDHSWVKPRTVEVRLNETLGLPGHWEYAVDEVQDGFGNIQKYADSGDDADYRPRPKHLTHEFEVKERPRARLQGCDLRNPLKVAKGKSLNLPVSFSMSGKAPHDTAHALTWEFSPFDSLTDSGEHGDAVSVESYRARNSHDRPTISAPGLYTLKSVSSNSCEGEIQEPSSCLLLNPLEPSLSIRSEEIPDKCAGKSIGLRVDLDFTGTPPFTVHYTVAHKDNVRSETVRVNGLRHQIELRPREAGHHRYIFARIDDDIYKSLPLTGLTLEQDVKPPAGAFIQHATGKQNACLEQQVEVDVLLLGDAPFTLEWEMVHDGKRKAERVTGIESPSYTIKTQPLNKGGDHILSLNSVTDRSGCRVFLQDELKIAVRRQRPRASFGLVENKRTVMAVEDAKVNLPLRLQGEAPWTISYRNVDTGKTLQKIAHNGNDFLPVQSKGVFEIINVVDKQCPGSVDPQGSQFAVDWFPRPDISLVPAEGITAGTSGFIKRDVCEGDIDGFEVNLQGSAPYHVEYQIGHKPFQGSSSLRAKELDVALNRASVPLDTAKAGDYTYTFSTLADNLYNNGKSKDPLVVRQRVNEKPSASFVKPGQSFKYCKLEQDNEDNIPISLSGVAPFYVELEIKHHGATVPETYRIQSIKSNSHNIQIPRQHLHLGAQHVRIREVRDARGCQRRYDLNAPSVQVHLYEAPAMYPLESRRDYCVGERIAYTLSGTPPFEVWYDFQGQQRKAKSATTSFRRIAETPGDFTITSISDKASECRASVEITKSIHPLPAVKISKGRQTRVDIHEGNEVEILFEFWGTPPFEFTYTRSSNAKKGQKSVVLETRHDVSYDSSKIVKASQEGTYEVVAIKDKFCSFSTQQAVEDKDQKLLKY